MSGRLRRALQRAGKITPLIRASVLRHLAQSDGPLTTRTLHTLVRPRCSYCHLRRVLHLLADDGIVIASWVGRVYDYRAGRQWELA